MPTDRVTFLAAKIIGLTLAFLLRNYLAIFMFTLMGVTVFGLSSLLTFLFNKTMAILVSILMTLVSFFLIFLIWVLVVENRREREEHERRIEK